MTTALPGETSDSANLHQELNDLLQTLLGHWNERRPEEYAALFTESGNVVGFDGSPVDGRRAIAEHLASIFAHHQTAAYVGKVREVRLLAPGVALVRAVVGMIPPGQTDLNPAANAVQSLIATRRDGAWRIELFQNTPAAFHGRPEASAALTDELRALL